MRRMSTLGGISLKAYAGTTGVILAFNATEDARRGLLGFAVHRSAPDGSERWLPGELVFPGLTRSPGEAPLTRDAPIQAFRWEDFAVYPNQTYTYTAHPVYGTPGQLEIRPGPSVTVTTQPQNAGEHVITFNRAAAASQAFAKRFENLDSDLARRREAGLPPLLPAEAYDWLSRGLLEQITGFFDQAVDETWAVDIAIYEYELLPILHAVERALQRRVQVRIVYHAKKGDEQTELNEQNLARLPTVAKRGRVTSAIHHHKFMVRSKIVEGQRVPHAVLCGSTNFTENGVYRQANVVHVIQTPAAARSYLDLFEQLFAGQSTKSIRTWIAEHNALPEARPESLPELFIGFSPRTGGGDLALMARLIGEAKRDVLFCTAFELHDSIQKALWGEDGDDVLRLGIQNRLPKAPPSGALGPLSPHLLNVSAGQPEVLENLVVGTHRDRSKQFVSPAMLPGGLEGYLKETLAGQKGNILIHTKLIVLDFTGDAPTVISGSHNFSQNASKNNDENYLILHGNTDVADAYACELLRIYDHYRFRVLLRQDFTGTVPTLRPDDRWTDDYYGGDPFRTMDRVRFGAAVN